MADPDLPDLADLDELLALLPAGASSTRASQALKQASRRFRGDVRHPVSRIEHDAITLDGDGTITLLLPADEVTDVELVKVAGEEITDYQWSRAGILRRRCWPDGLGNIEVTYTHGYDPIPGEIQEVVLIQAQYQYATMPGLSSMQVGGQTLSWSAAGVSEAWNTVVDAYRLNRGDRS